jgi:hypothetical protein
MDIFLLHLSALPQIFLQIALVGMHTWYFALPVLLFPVFFYVWMWHIVVKYSMSVPKIMLELIAPKDLEKSPQLMEGLFDGIAGTDKTYTVYEEYVLGMGPPTFSLEIIGSDGRAHFYIRTQAIFRHLVEAHLYAQYPDIEIVEVEDYINEVPKDLPNKDWNFWGTDFKLLKADAYPIKTYHAFEESVTGKMIDPLAGLIEVIAKLPPGQKIWLQYIISVESHKWYTNEGRVLVDELVKGKKEKPPTMMAMLLSTIAGIFGGAIRGIFGTASVETKKTDNKLDPIDLRLTPVQRKILEAIEANIGKNVFKVKMRMLYLGQQSNFNKGTFLNAIVGAIAKPYNDGNLNSIIVDAKTKTSAEYVFMKSRILYAQRRLFRRYRDRDRDPNSNVFVLSTSELATLFHLPDGAIVSPALSRVTAKRGGSPFNLPIE